jgi:hypothetical protein
MQYALLAYAPPEDTDRATRPIPGTLAALLDRPDVTGWARLHAEESATTLRNSAAPRPGDLMGIAVGHHEFAAQGEDFDTESTGAPAVAKRGHPGPGRPRIDPRQTAGVVGTGCLTHVLLAFGCDQS